MEFALIVFSKLREVGEGLDVSARSQQKFTSDCFFQDIRLQIPMNKSGGVVANFDNVIWVIRVKQLVVLRPLFFILFRPPDACLDVRKCVILSA